MHEDLCVQSAGKLLLLGTCVATLTRDVLINTTSRLALPLRQDSRLEQGLLPNHAPLHETCSKRAFLVTKFTTQGIETMLFQHGRVLISSAEACATAVGILGFSERPVTRLISKVKLCAWRQSETPLIQYRTHRRCVSKAAREIIKKEYAVQSSGVA